MEVKINYYNDPKKDRAAFDNGLLEFKKQVKKSELMNELRRREAYMPPSKYRRWRKNEALKRRKRENRKQEWNNKNRQIEW